MDEDEVSLADAVPDEVAGLTDKHPKTGFAAAWKARSDEAVGGETYERFISAGVDHRSRRWLLSA